MADFGKPKHFNFNFKHLILWIKKNFLIKFTLLKYNQQA